MRKVLFSQVSVYSHWGEGLLTLDGGGGESLSWPGGTYLGWGRGVSTLDRGTYLGWGLSHGVPTLAWGYLPWMGVPTLNGGTYPGPR